PRVNQEKDANINSTNNINNVSPTDNAAGIKENTVDENIVYGWYTQEEGIDYDEVFALVARIEAYRLFLAYALFKDFVVYQIDVKSAFLYGKIEEEVYVCQPPSFEDLNFPDRVYKVEKALYGLHQAPKAWDKSDILLVQIFVGDINFGSTRKKMCTEFEKMMHKKSQMSSMRELTFFLGLQVKQKEDGIFISQDKYVNEILNKFGFSNVKTTSTPMETHKTLLNDEKGKDVDEHLYRSMIGLLMYLTFLRPDIMFAVCACARFQVNPKISHLHDVKKIFRYLKGQPKLGLWYPKDPPFNLVVYTDSDYVGASLDRKSTTGGCQFLWCRLILWQCKKQTVVANSITEAEEGYLEWNEKAAKDEIGIHLRLYIFDNMVKHLDSGNKFLMYPRFVQVFLDKQVDGMSKHNAIYVLPYHTKKIFENMKRVRKEFSRRDTPRFPTMLVQAQADMGEGSTMPSAPQHTPSFIQPTTSKTQKKQKPRKPRRQDTHETQPSDPIDEALNVENTSQAKEILSLKKRVKRLEKKKRSRTHGLKRLCKVGFSSRVESSADEESLGEEDASKQRRISSIDANQDIYLVNVYRDKDMFGVNDQDDTLMFDADKDLQGEEVVVEDVNVASIATSITAAATTAVSINDITLT
nr:copia protein [Tanacetum cinerariifolium]